MNALQRKKQKHTSTFVSLPRDIILNCLARVPRSHYPKLYVVSKFLRSLIVSDDLMVVRFLLKTHEPLFCACLQFPNKPSPSFFALGKKPGHQILTTQLKKRKKKKKKMMKKNKNTLVKIPSSYYPFLPMHVVEVDSVLYCLQQSKVASSSMLVGKTEYPFYQKSPNMIVPRKTALSCVLNGKIYVMGGCASNESTTWGEVFDPKTQTWEPLPEPIPELRFSSVRKLEVIKEKLYVRSNKTMDSVYDPKEGKWGVAPKSVVQCSIDNISYYCTTQSCFWYDTNMKEWRVVRGLDTFNRNHRRGRLIEIYNYGGKLLILWDKSDYTLCCNEKSIWCALIALERPDGTDEVWGNMEWANKVLTVPSSYVFLHGLINHL